MSAVPVPGRHQEEHERDADRERDQYETNSEERACLLHGSIIVRFDWLQAARLLKVTSDLGW